LTDALLTGHPIVDAEHERLRLLLNELLNFRDTGDDKRCAEKIIEITKAVVSHFESEEAIMEELGYLNLVRHKEEHRTTVIKYDALIEDSKRAGYGNNFANELTAILVSDMIRADMDFKMYLQDE